MPHTLLEGAPVSAHCFHRYLMLIRVCEFVEKVFNSFYNGHASLRVYLESFFYKFPIIIPSGGYLPLL